MRPSQEARRDQDAYAFARQFLLSLPGVTRDRLDRHLDHHAVSRPRNLSAVFRRMLITAQNKGMASTVIGEKRVRKLKPLLGGFDPSYVRAKYGDNWNRVLRDVQRHFPRLPMSRTPNGLWPQFCRTVTSAAAFLSRFESAADLRRWIRVFDKDERTRPALPMLLSHEIAGFGFPLACDFLKEIGYPNFGKPDVHLKKIFAALELSSGEADYDVFKAIVRVAQNSGTTPYAVDKLFWLIGSGNFHLDDLKIGGHRDEFIAHAKERFLRVGPRRKR